uniref:Protein Ycf2 n=2 Tax=Zantedeschia TaxID=69720 RepID=A0A6M3W370_9ARAE|nr:Ycf2 [Zantedeschia hybrid cultivar]YP_009582495.1 Ycf2 [Zantedeschia hybrid cultivar]QJF46718.1 hypothetical protein Ycf2 [Zantedeschia rehmannii]QBK84093.1 Ycf2 [Zantedeschia hybrid cultivar]QBK84117.1 Ycf2 [Zantedeschia hybrid cultivar]QJF46744.1 hypothetical protein Ycf2 [Zantedeschia rehmannii]
MNRNRQFKFWTLELREILRKIKNSRSSVYSWIKFGSVVSFTHIFFHQERFMKLFDPRVLGILLSRDSRGSTRNRYFTTIKGVVLLVVAVLIFRINNQKMVERKNLYLMELLPIPTNSIGPANDTLEESFLSSNINRLIVSLLYLPKRKRLSEDPHESTWVLPINQKCIMPESNRGSRWWSNRIRKKRDSSCKISNETVVGIEISFKEKDSKYLEFLFLSYTPIRKDPDWELFYRFSPRKKRNIINSNSPFEILGKDMICYLMPAFREKRREGFFKQQGAEATIQSEHVSHLFLFSRNKWDISLQNCAQFHMWQFRQDLFVGWNKNRHESDFLRNLIWLDDVNVWLVNKDRFFSKLRNVLLNIQYDSTRSISVQVTDSRRRRRSSHQFRDFFDSIRNEDSKYHKLIDQTEILWNPSTERTEIETEREKRMNNHLLPEEIEEFLGNSTRSIRSFFSDKWSELHLGSTRDQKFLKKKQDVSFVPSRRSENKKMVDIFKIIKYLQNTVSIHPISSDPGCDMVVPKDSEERFKKMANLFILSITESDLVYRRGFAFSIDSSGLTFLNRARDESKNQSLLVESFYRRIIEKSVRGKGPKLKIVVFDIMEAVYKYKRLIIQYIRNVLFRFFLMNRSDRNYVQKALNYIRYVLFRFFLMNRSDRNYVQKALNYIRYVLFRFFLMNRSYRNYVQKALNHIRYVLFRFFLMNRSYRNYVQKALNHIRYVLFRFFLMNRSYRNYVQKALNHITIMKYMINSNLKKSQKKWFDPLFSRTERCMNRDPNTYRYKRSNGSKNFQEHLEHFLSEQRNRFQVVFDQLRININQFLIDYTQPLSFFLSKILHLFFMSVRNISIHRSRQIYIYELNRTNDQLCNQLLESIGAEIIHLNKMKSDDRRNSERIRLRFIKIPSLTVHTRDTRNNRRKSLFNPVSFFSTYDPVKPFRRGPLVYAFYKASRPGFNNPHFLWFCYCNKGFPFHVEKKTRINNYDFTYRQLLHTLFIRHKIFSIINKKKKNIFIFGGGEAVLPIDLKVSDISNYFPKSGNETYNLYKSFYVPTIPDPFVRIGIYLIADISSTPLTEKEMANFERTSCQPFSDMDLSGKNLCQYLSFNSNRGLIHTPCYKKLSGKRKKWSLCLKKCVENQHEKQQIYRTLQRDIDSALSNRSKRWNLFKTYMPWLFTSTGFKYLYFTLLDAFSDSLLILSISIRQKFVPIFHDIMHRLDISWKRRWMLLTQCSRISKISSKCLQKLLLYEETIHKNNESPFPALWPLIRSVNIQGLIYEILFLLIFVGYLININLLVFSRAFSELQTELEKIKFFFIPSYMIELEELLDKYPISISKQKQQDSYEDEDSFIAVFENGNKNFFFNIINLISNLISNPISFWINTRHLSRTSKEIYAWIRKRKKIYDYAIEDILFSPIGTSDLIDDIPSLIAASDTSAYEYQFYNSDFNLGSIGDEYKKVKRWSQLYNLTIKNRIDQILLSLTHSDRLSKNESGYQMIEQPGSIYLGYLVDIHKKYLMDYKFNRSCLAERRIFLAHYQTITYSQTSRGANSFRFPSSHGKPFSLRLSLSPSRGILVIGSKGTGRSYLVKSLATNSYLPFITISTYRFPNYRPQGPYMEFIKKWNFLYKLFRFVFRDSYDCDSPFSPAYYNSNYFYEYERTEDFLDPRQIFYDDSDNIDDDEVQSLLDALKLEGKSCLKIHLFIFCFSLQFELAKAISPCIIWIPDIHDLYMDESDDLSLGLLANSLSMNCESHSTNLVIASTHIPKKVDPALIAPNKSNTCIKVRRLLIPQRRKHLFTLLYTKGFHLEKQIKGFESMPVSSSAQDLVALTNEAISISMAQRKSIIETDTIRLALHRQTHVLRARVRPIEDHGIIFYQIGRAVVQNVLLNNCLIDPISIYMKKRLQDDFLYKWYFELGTSMKKLTILLYLLSCSAGQVAQDLWSPPGPDETSGRTSSGFVGNDSDLVHGLLELEDALVGSSRKEKDCSQFDNNPLFLRSEPRNPLDIMKNKSCRFQYENNEYGTGFAGEEDGDLDQQEKEDYLLNHIVWAPRIWRPWYNLFNCFERFNESGFSYGAHEENESMLEDKDSQWNWEFFRSESEQVRYQMRDMFSRERGFFREIQFIWEPEDPLFFLFKDQPIVSAFSRREIFSDEEIAKGFFLTSQINTPLYLYNRGLLENTPEIELLIHRQRRLGTNSSLFYRSFRSNTILESYQYLSNLFLSNRRLLDQITRTLLRKGWLFPDEIQHLINNELNH